MRTLIHPSAQADTKKSLLQSYFEPSAWLFFITICLIYAFVGMYQQTFILTDEVYYNSLGEQLTMERIQSMIDLQAKWEWLSYLFIPIVIFLQALLVSICLNTGTLLFDYKVKFGKIFGMTMKAIGVFAIARLVFLLLMSMIDINTFDDLTSVDIFSLLAAVGAENVPEWLYYPLQVVNVFEMIFFLVLAAGMSNLTGKSQKAMLSFVAITYGTGLIVWILFMVFIQLNLST